VGSSDIVIGRVLGCVRWIRMLICLICYAFDLQRTDTAVDDDIISTCS